MSGRRLLGTRHQLRTAYMWESDIGEHQIYPAIVLLKNPDRLKSVGGWQHDIARPFENLSDGSLKAFLVFYQKDRC